MPKKMDLLERIDELTVNSVTPEEFKKTWGYGLDEYVADMMDHLRRLKGKHTKLRLKTELKQRNVARPAAAVIKPAAAALPEAELDRAIAPMVKAVKSVEVTRVKGVEAVGGKKGGVRKTAAKGPKGKK